MDGPNSPQAADDDTAGIEGYEDLADAEGDKQMVISPPRSTAVTSQPGRCYLSSLPLELLVIIFDLLKAWPSGHSHHEIIVRNRLRFHNSSGKWSIDHQSPYYEAEPLMALAMADPLLRRHLVRHYREARGCTIAVDAVRKYLVAKPHDRILPYHLPSWLPILRVEFALRRGFGHAFQLLLQNIKHGIGKAELAVNFVQHGSFFASSSGYAEDQRILLEAWSSIACEHKVDVWVFGCRSTNDLVQGETMAADF